MIFEVAIGDRVRTVGIVRKDGLLQVDLDGRLHLVDARRINDSVVSMLVQLDGDAAPSRSIDASFAHSTHFARSGPAVQPVAGDLDVHLDGRTIPVQIRPAGSFGRQKKEGGASGSGPQRVVSPMPGKVVRVLVKPGDQVTARQGLVVVEAMKMENELTAHRDGAIEALQVAAGDAVKIGDVVAVIR